MKEKFGMNDQISIERSNETSNKDKVLINLLLQLLKITLTKKLKKG